MSITLSHLFAILATAAVRVSHQDLAHHFWNDYDAVGLPALIWYDGASFAVHSSGGRRGEMRKLVVLTFVTLDGVMQGPGGPAEDTTGGFTLGGWTVPYFDEVLGNTMGEQMGEPFDLLLGRKTFEI